MIKTQTLLQKAIERYFKHKKKEHFTKNRFKFIDNIAIDRNDGKKYLVYRLDEKKNTIYVNNTKYFIKELF